MFAYYLIAALTYVFAVAFLFAPKCPKPSQAEAPVNYFPEDQEPELSPTAPETAQALPEPEPVAEAPEAEATAQTSQALPEPEPVATEAPETAQAEDLTRLPYSELKRRAKALKIPRYSRLSKAELVGALA